MSSSQENIFSQRPPPFTILLHFHRQLAERKREASPGDGTGVATVGGRSKGAGGARIALRCLGLTNFQPGEEGGDESNVCVVIGFD